MFYYYKDEQGYVCSRRPLQNGAAVCEQEAAEAAWLRYVSHCAGEGKISYCINHPAYLCEEAEGLWCLDRCQMEQMAQGLEPIPQWLQRLIAAGKVQGVDSGWYQQGKGQAVWTHSKEKKRVHILAMGDVGSTLLMGLALLGGDCIHTIGIYDFNEKLCQRWEHEINQIGYPWAYDRLPQVEVIDRQQLFQCDVFVFCASKAIPPVGAEVQDVRMAQLEANSQIIGEYGKLAREAGFAGLFAVVSDPVDPLCQRVWSASNRDGAGRWDGLGLRPEQVQGYGLGVMNSRAAYFAKQDERFARFLQEGRAYGPHGQQLVIADSVTDYHHDLSLELTEKTVKANLEVRALGYKPYVAPALSSAAISILLTLRGEWHYSSNFLGGIYMGAKNRSTVYGLELEHLPLPPQLLERLQTVVSTLEELCQ